MRKSRFRDGLWAGGRIASLPGLVALLAVLVLQLAEFVPLSRAGQLLFDAYGRADPRPYEPAPVRVVDIDEESIRRLGQWPWPRNELAALVRRLADAGAVVVAFDIVFSEPDRTSPPQIARRLKEAGGDSGAIATLERLADHDAELASSFAEVPVVTGFFLTHDPAPGRATPKAGFAVSGSPPAWSVPRYPGAILPLPALQRAAQGTGSLTLEGDSDGIVRKVPLLMKQRDQLLPALSLEALRLAQGAGAILVKTSDGSGSVGGGRREAEVIAVKVGAFEVPATASGALWMHYTAPAPQRTVAAWRVLSGALSQPELEELFAGTIVFVGAGAIGLRDLVSTPVQDRELGVMVHAQAAEQMILGRFLVRPDWALGLERALVFLLGLVLLLLLPRLGAVRGAALGLLLAGGTLAASWYAFSHQRFLLDPTYPLLAVLAVYVVQTALTYYAEERRRRYIHRAFDRYLAPELVRRIAADPRQLELAAKSGR